MLTDSAPNPRAWAVATALAAESGLDWAAWARGETADRYACGTCGAELRIYSRCTQPAGRRMCGGQSRADHVPVPAPWDADAYRADAARRGVEPGPMPSLEYEGDRVHWSVNVRADGSMEVLIDVGDFEVGFYRAWPDTEGKWRFNGSGIDDGSTALRLAIAAKRAMGT